MGWTYEVTEWVQVEGVWLEKYADAMLVERAK